MTNVIDASMTLTVEYSPWRMASLIVGSFAFVWVGVAMAYGPLGGDEYVTFGLGWFIAIFFGLCGLIGLSRLLTNRSPVMVFSPEGLLDQRLSSAVISWTGIDDIDEWLVYTRWPAPPQKGLLLKVKPETEATLPLTPTVRMTRSANRMLGIDGLTTTALGTEINHVRLMKVARAYWEAHGTVSVDRSQNHNEPNPVT